jgi:replicative DNA helicase
MTRGYQPGEITIVGAKSGVGKTSLLIQSAVANITFPLCSPFWIEMSESVTLLKLWPPVSVSTINLHICL